MRRTHGIALRTDLVRLGVPERTLRRRAADGLLVPVTSRVVALPGQPMDLVTLTRAAVMTYPRALPTGPSAAAILGRGPWDGMDLGTTPWLVHPARPAMAARRVSHPGITTVRASGVVVASPGDALTDLLRFWPMEEATALAHRALQLGTTSVDALVAAHARLSGYAGAAQLRRVIQAVAGGARSQAEHRLAELLGAAGITGWIANHRVRAAGRVYELDVAFPSQRLAIEVDGRAFHTDARTFQSDRRRQNDLVAAGWTVLRFTWSDIVDRPDYVIDRIMLHLSRTQRAG